MHSNFNHVAQPKPAHTIRALDVERLALSMMAHLDITRALVAAVLLLTTVGSTAPSLAGETMRPNVVFILADDQSYRDFGFMGNALVHTPNLDQLARQAARYPNGYVPMSVCRPSLATILTGLYPHQHGIHFNHPPPGLRAMRKMTAAEYRATRAQAEHLIRDVRTLPRILAKHGYACLQTGKHWEGDYTNAGFTDGMTLGTPATPRDAVHGTRRQDNGEWVAHGNGDAGLAIGRDTMQPIADFLDQHAGRRPFFIWYAPFLPHVPFNAPERFRKLYEGRDVPRHLLPYYAEIARFDETVGQLIGMLERRGVLGNTLVVFASDNGFRPDKRRHENYDQRSKLSQFEDGLRTPILIRWDQHVEPAEHSRLVQTVDLVPTVLSAVGLAEEITPRLKGINLMPSAEGSSQLPNRPACGAIYPNDATELGNPARHVRARWIRDGDFKLVVPGPAKPAIPLSLFDLRADPLEEHNLLEGHAADRYAEQVARLGRLLDAWWDPPSRPVHVVFDTDISGDVDDVLALAMLHALADRGECVIEAVTISKINSLTAPFVDAVNTFYGRPDIPIGVTRHAQQRDSKYLKLANTRDGGTCRYPHDLLSSDKAPDAVDVLRRVLARAPDHSITLIQVGLAANLADLLDSAPDSVSPLNGRELVRAKVRLVSVMAGAFAPVQGNSHYLEANVRNGIHAMQTLASRWPDDVPIIWSGFLIGLAAPYPRASIARDFTYRKHHIVQEAYLLHSGPNHDRPTWDLTSVLQAVRPDDGYFELSERGRVTVDDDGFTSFTSNPHGRDRYLKINDRQTTRVIATQRALVSQPPSSPAPPPPRVP